MNKAVKTLTMSLALLFVSVAPVSADTLIKFGLDEPGTTASAPDLQYFDGVFQTVNQGDASTLGDQNTGLLFTGFLQGVMADIVSGASLTIADVFGIGAAYENPNIGTISQQTSGGTLSIWDNNNALLLSAELGEGVITGAANVPTGSFFSTEFVNFTGGSMLQFINPFPGNISLSMLGITTGQAIGLLVNEGGELQNFTGFGNGLVTAQEISEIPEPATAMLILSGLLGTVMRRRSPNVES
jgi:hypothetical protein